MIVNSDTHQKILGTPLVFLKGFVLGIIVLGSFYYLLLFAITQDPGHPFNQFALLQPWMSFLIIGFGVQVGLFQLLRKGFHLSIQENKNASLAAGSGTAVSGVAMVACCAHHMVEILPILGFSAAALILSEYQEQLLIIGAVVNLVGIFVMLWMIFGKAKQLVIFNFITKTIKRAL